MSELSDYRRCVEAPMISNYEATIKSLRAAQRDAWRANATEFKELCSEWEARVTALEKALAGIEWKSADRDNMEFTARITCYQMDALLSAKGGET
jgi:hypothetical protein